MILPYAPEGKTLWLWLVDHSTSTVPVKGVAKFRMHNGNWVSDAASFPAGLQLASPEWRFCIGEDDIPGNFSARLFHRKSQYQTQRVD